MCPRRGVERKSQSAVNQLFPHKVADGQNTCCSQITYAVGENHPELSGKLNVGKQRTTVTQINSEGLSH